MRVLVIEDSVRLQRTLGTALRKSGYAVDLSGDGEEGLWLANSNIYDVVVLDLMLPKLDGLCVLADMRRRSNDVHVLLLTARDSVADRVQGLRDGADDYLVKPFALEEFLARVQALCRRVYGDKRNVLAIGDLAIDTLKRTARRANHIQGVSPA
jgi:DNA-binding response OmpR family regulator